MDNPYQSPTPFEASLAEPSAGGAVSVAEMNRAVLVFRGLLLLYAALIGASIVASFALTAYLPLELQAYVESEAGWTFDSAAVGFAVVGMGLVALLVLILGWFGMLFFWRPARWLFLASQLMILPLMVLLGPSVMHGIEYALDSASQLTSGAILAMAFFSPVRMRFSKPKKTALS